MFSEIVTMVGSAAAPFNCYLTLLHPILYPVKLHVHCFESFEFCALVCKAVCNGIVCCDLGWAVLWSIQFMKDFSNVDGFLTCVEQCCYLCFRGCCHDIFEYVAFDVNGSIWFGVNHCLLGFPRQKYPPTLERALGFLRYDAALGTYSIIALLWSLIAPLECVAA
jgi:hypothetical protein